MIIEKCNLELDYVDSYWITFLNKEPMIGIVDNNILYLYEPNKYSPGGHQVELLAKKLEVNKVVRIRYDSIRHT